MSQQNWSRNMMPFRPLHCCSPFSDHSACLDGDGDTAGSPPAAVTTNGFDLDSICLDQLLGQLTGGQVDDIQDTSPPEDVAFDLSENEGSNSFGHRFRTVREMDQQHGGYIDGVLQLPADFKTRNYTVILSVVPAAAALDDPNTLINQIHPCMLRIRVPEYK